MKKTLNRGLALALVLLMALAMATPALAASKTMIVTASTQVRSSPGQTTTNIIGTLNKNNLVVQTGTTGMWSIIEFEGRTAYVLSSRLATYSNTVINNNTNTNTPTSGSYYEGQTVTGRTVYATATVNVRKGPGTNYSKIGQLSAGTAVSKVGETGDWALIEWNDSIAYVSLRYLSGSSSGSGSSGTVSGSNLVQATANVNVRSGPGTNYSVIGWLAKGETVTKTGTSGNWTKVSFNNGTGYISSSYLRTYTGSGGATGGTTSGSSSYTTLIANVSTAIRSGPSTGNRAIGYLDPGDTITLLDTYGMWYRVQFGSHANAYVYAPDMRVLGAGGGSISSASGYVYAPTTVRVYSNASTSSSTLGYLYAGESAQRTGTTGSFTRINFGGLTGYVVTSQVTTNYTGSTGNMTSIRSYMYSRYDNVACYTTPYESSTYYHGRLSLYERVWAIEGNSTWTKIEVSGYTLYTRTDNLTYSYYGGGYYDGSYNGVGVAYSYQNNGTRLYTDASLSTLLRDSYNTSEIVTIPYLGSATVIFNYSGATSIQVQFDYTNLSGRTTRYTGYVRASEVKVM